MLRAPFTLIGNLIYFFRFILSQAFWRLAKRFQKHPLYVKINVPTELPFGRHKLETYFSDTPTLLDFKTLFEQLASDDSVKGVILRFDGDLTRSKAADFLETLEPMRAAGKEIVGHTDQATLATLRSLAACDRAVVSPASRFYAFGGRIENYFMKPLFKKVGVSAQFFHIGEFKTATSRFVRDSMSDSERAMLRSLLHGLESHSVEEIADGRRLTSQAVSDALDHAPIEPRVARREGLIDGEVFLKAIHEWLRQGDSHRHNDLAPQAEDDSPRFNVVSADDYSQPLPFRWKPIFKRTKQIALMDLNGAIAHPGQGERGIVSKDVISTLRRLKSDRRVSGVLLHINSPGGSALASDLMWYEIDQLRKRKPVVAYLGDVAASGGYYLAIGADRIVCRPDTLTGSIGVITGKVSFGEVAEKLIRIDSIQQRESGNFGSLVEPIEGDIRENFEREIRSAYRRFLERVGIARKLPKRRLHRFARGRVYLGSQAKTRGLVDEIGGFKTAVQTMRELIVADSGESTNKIVYYPHTKPKLGALVRRNAISSSIMRRLGTSFAQAELDLQLVSQKQPTTLAYCPIELRE